MRNILEEAILAVLNEESETAGELMRQFIISKSQAIHESLRQGDEPILEFAADDLDSEKYFTDEDLTDTSTDDVTADDAADDLSDDLGTDGDVAADDVDAGVDVDADAAPADEGSVDERLDDIEAQLDEFSADFEKLMAELEGEAGDVDGDIDADLGADEKVEADVDGNIDVDADADATVGGDVDDEFADINESILDELEKITVANTEGRHTDGSTSKTDDEAFASQREKDAGPIVTKRDDHVGFDREAAPKSDRLPKGKNTLEKSTSVQSKVTSPKGLK